MNMVDKQHSSYTTCIRNTEKELKKKIENKNSKSMWL